MKSLTKLFLGLGGLAAVCGGVACGTAIASGKNFVYADYAADGIIANPGASYSTKRIWVVNNNTSFWTSSAKMGIGCDYTKDGAAAYARIEAGTHTNHGGQTFFFFDIPLSATKFKLLRCSSDYATVWNETGEVTDIVPSKIYFVDTSSYSAVPSMGTANGYSPDCYLMANVLRGYLTCNGSSDNGYGAVTNLTSTWYSYLDVTSNGTPSTVSLEDYPVGASSSGTYSGTKTASVTVAEKWAGLVNMNANNGNWKANSVSVSSDEKTPTIVLGGLTIVSVAAAGGYFFIRKKHVA